PHAARRIRASPKGLSRPDDEGDRSALLDRAGTDVRKHVSRAAAGRASQDARHSQAMGAAALLRAGHAPRSRRLDPVLTAQSRRRQEPRHRRRRGMPGYVVRASEGPSPHCQRASRRRRAETAVMTTPIVELRKATKKYAGVPAIEDVDFALLPGEIHTLVGENGAGKSTLTKVMAGVVGLTSGQMLVEGREVRPETPVQALHLGI